MDTSSLLNVVTKVAFVLTISSFFSGVPVCINIWKNRTTGALDPAPFLSMVLSCCLWFRYGFLIQDQFMIIINSVGLFMAVAYSLFFLSMADKRPLAVKKLFYTILLTAGIVVCAAASQDIIFFSGLAACVSSVVSSASPLAALPQVIKSKSTESLPFVMIIFTFIVNMVWFTYGLLVGDSFIFVQNFVCFAICSAQLALFAIYPARTSTKKLQ